MSFSKDFLWGTATAAHQVEGAYLEDGKTLNVWDALCEGKVKYGENARVTCDQYHRYKEDVALMKKIGCKSYRFSISWARIFPASDGKINEKGIGYYSDLVDELLNAGIEPLVTLYHWDMPMWVFEQGGWENDGVRKLFSEYAKAVVEALSDRVRYWMTFNEPQMFVGLGHFLGTHAPFLRLDDDRLHKISRNIMFSHGDAVKTIRKFAKKKPMVGFAFANSCSIPENDSAESIEKARRITFSDRQRFMGVSYWSDPLVLGTVPEELKGTLTQDDMRQICLPLDFYGYNTYQAADQMNPSERGKGYYPGMPRTAGGWALCDDLLYWTSKFFYERYKLPVLITENGCTNADWVMLDGKVHDPQRIDYIERGLKGLKRAVVEGVPVLGYQVWSLLDNFEWADGYSVRYGLIHVDYRTLERRLKDSAMWYSNVIETNGKNL